MIRQVLVPIDGSPGVERLVLGAAAMAGRLDAGLLLLGVSHPGANRAAEEERLYGLLQRHAHGRGAFMVEITTDPAGAVLHHAETHPATLIATLSHGQGRIGETAIGSVTGELLQRTHTPTLVFGPRVDPSGLEASTWRNVLACVDGSDRGERALDIAADFARAAGLGLTVLQAVTPHDAVFDLSRTQEYVEALAKLSRPAAGTRVVTSGDRPAGVICQTADGLGGAIVAVASRGRGGPGRADEHAEPLGSVTDELIRTSRGPVLVIPAAARLVAAMGRR